MKTFAIGFLIGFVTWFVGFFTGYNFPHPEEPVTLECACGSAHCGCEAPCKCQKMECGGLDCETMKLRTDVEAIYGLINSGNGTSYSIMDYQQRCYHYIAGHDFRHPVLGCPECGLIGQLEKRKNVLYSETVRISESLTASGEDNGPIRDRDEHDRLVERLSAIQAELNEVEQHVHTSDARAIEVGKQMKAE